MDALPITLGSEFAAYATSSITKAKNNHQLQHKRNYKMLHLGVPQWVMEQIHQRGIEKLQL